MSDSDRATTVTIASAIPHLKSLKDVQAVCLWASYIRSAIDLLGLEDYVVEHKHPDPAGPNAAWKDDRAKAVWILKVSLVEVWPQLLKGGMKPLEDNPFVIYLRAIRAALEDGQQLLRR